MNKWKRGVESPKSVEVNERKSGVVDNLKRYGRNCASAVAAVLALGISTNEAQANTETVGDIRYDKDLLVSGSGVPLLDVTVGGYTIENAIDDGGLVEINSHYSLRIKSGSDGKEIEFLDNSGQVVESHTFLESINPVKPVLSLGNDYFVLYAQGKLYIFNGLDVGSQSGTTFRESNRTATSGVVTHKNKHPQTGDIVGVTLYGGSPDGSFFSYGTGDFTPTHPIPGSGLKINQALNTFGALNGNGELNGNFIISNVIGHNVVFAVEDANGNYKQWINPESDEVVLPTPVITAPSEFSLNVNDLLSGKVLELSVVDMPENGSVKIVVDGNEFALNETSAGVFAKVFTSQELMQIEGGEFDMIAEIRVIDVDGGVLASEDIDISVDVVAPNGVDFSIDGAHIENMGVSEISVIESEEIPVEVTLRWMDISSDLLSLISIPIKEISMTDFIVLSYEEQKEYVMQYVDFSDEDNDIALSGNLGQVKDIDMDATSVTVEIGEGGHVTAIFAIDEAGNLTVSIKGVDVRKIDTSGMTCEENPNQDKCEVDPMDETREENPAQEKCDVVEPEQPVDKEEPETPEEDGDKDGSGDEEGGGCSITGTGDAPVDGGLALGALGLLGMVGAGKRRKRKIVKRKK